jgi:hypothetical protein
MRTSIIVLGLLIAFSAMAGDKGNGGYSIVCRDNGGPIVSAELLDIYEGKVLYKKKYGSSDADPSQIIQSVVAKVNNYSIFQAKLVKELALLEKNKIFIPVGNELEPTDDAFPPIKKKGCEFEQVANYTSLGELLISEEIYERFDNANKAALMIHEAIYAIRRKSLGDTNSQASRRFVAQLLAADGDLEVIERWIFDSVQRPNTNRSCGLEGTLQERIESCSYVEKDRFSMVLVTRTEGKKEVWYDPDLKLLWSDRVQNFLSYENAKNACQENLEEMGHLNENFMWRLPKAEEYLFHGENLEHILPNISRAGHGLWFWTGTTKGRFVATYTGGQSSIGYSPFRGGKGSVRCVATAP